MKKKKSFNRILRSNSVFICVPLENCIPLAHRLGAKYIVSEHDLCQPKSNKPIQFERIERLQILDRDLLIYKRIDDKSVSFHDENIIFCACTSGSTGQPKTICVPHKCIWANVHDLRLVNYNYEFN